MNNDLHWIAQYRAKHGFTIKQLSNLYSAKYKRLVSRTLIDNVENGDRVHPFIAARLAELCGATAEQYDEIVYVKYQGTWKPGIRDVEFKRRIARRKVDYYA